MSHYGATFAVMGGVDTAPADEVSKKYGCGPFIGLYFSIACEGHPVRHSPHLMHSKEFGFFTGSIPILQITAHAPHPVHFSLFSLYLYMATGLNKL